MSFSCELADVGSFFATESELESQSIQQPQEGNARSQSQQASSEEQAGEEEENPLKKPSANSLLTLAKKMDDFPETRFFRSFSTIRTLNLLALQNEIRQLEDEFHKFRQDQLPLTHKKVRRAWRKLRPYLREYDEQLMHMAEISEFERPGRWVFDDVDHTLAGIPGSRKLFDVKNFNWRSKYICPTKSPMGLFETIMITPILILRLANKMNLHGKNTRRVPIIRSTRIRYFNNVFTCSTFCLLVLTPIFGLQYMKTKTLKLVLVSIYICASCLLVTVVPKPSMTPSLAVIAAYAAILVAFLGQGVK